MRRGTEPVVFITYAWDEPGAARIEDVSPSLERARYWMEGRCGFVYRCERLKDGTYGNETFVEAIGQEPKPATREPERNARNEEIYLRHVRRNIGMAEGDH